MKNYIRFLLSWKGVDMRAHNVEPVDIHRLAKIVCWTLLGMVTPYGLAKLLDAISNFIIALR